MLGPPIMVPVWPTASAVSGIQLKAGVGRCYRLLRYEVQEKRLMVASSGFVLVPAASGMQHEPTVSTQTRRRLRSVCWLGTKPTECISFL